MKFILMSLVLISTQAFAAQATGKSVVYDMLTGGKVINITGNSAKALYDSLSVRGDRLDSTLSQKVGENVTCNKIKENGKTTYSCELTIDRNGKVGMGAHG